MSYEEYLRRLSIDAAALDERLAAPAPEMDAKTRALVRIAALIAASAAQSSIHREIDDAIAAGARASEIVGVLDAVMPLLGRACIVKAAPKVALALGVDLDLGE